MKHITLITILGFVGAGYAAGKHAHVVAAPPVADAHAAVAQHVKEVESRQQLQQEAMQLYGDVNSILTSDVQRELEKAFVPALRAALHDDKFKEAFDLIKKGIAGGEKQGKNGKKEEIPGLVQVVLSHMEVCDAVKVKLESAAKLIQQAVDKQVKAGNLPSYPGDEYVIELFQAVIKGIANSVEDMDTGTKNCPPQHAQEAASAAADVHAAVQAHHAAAAEHHEAAAQHHQAAAEHASK